MLSTYTFVVVSNSLSFIKTQSGELQEVIEVDELVAAI